MSIDTINDDSNFYKLNLYSTSSKTYLIKLFYPKRQSSKNVKKDTTIDWKFVVKQDRSVRVSPSFNHYVFRCYRFCSLNSVSTYDNFLQSPYFSVVPHEK